VRALLTAERLVNEAAAGEAVGIILDATGFYAENLLIITDN